MEISAENPSGLQTKAAPQIARQEKQGMKYLTLIIAFRPASEPNYCCEELILLLCFNH